MVSWSTHLRSMRGIASGTAIALFLSTGAAVAQDVPGDLWVVNYVKVTGANQDAVRNGLRQAADTYFYGFDTETHIEADVQESGTYNIRVIGPGGKVLARQNGLSYNPSGNIARSVSASAQGWMNNLGCGEGCAVAVSGGAPAQAVAVAAAPTPAEPVAIAEIAEEAIQRAEAEPPKPDTTTAAPEPVEPIAEIKIVEAPKVVKPVVSVPTAPAATGDIKVAAKPVETKKPEGLDADLVLARPNVATAPAAGRAATPAPATPKPAAAPSRPASQSVATPNVAAAPSAGSGSTAPTTPSVTTETPVVAAKPASPSVPEVRIVQPTSEAPETPEVATSTEVQQPSVAAVTPSVSIIPTEPEAEVPDTTVDTAVAVQPQQPQQPTAQEVTPGISLPAPTTGSTPSTVAEIAEPETPEVVTPEVSAVVPTIVTPAPAPAPTAIPTPTETETETAAETPAPASDDGDGEQLALVNPQQEVTPLPTPAAPAVETEALAPKPEQVETPAEAASQPEETDSGTTVETRIAAVDPTAEGPTLANARWVGFTPAVFTGSDNKNGAWISGPFDRKQRTGWITDTATGATTRVTFIWREGGSGSRTALLSREAAKALGLGQGDVANVAVYLPR